MKIEITKEQVATVIKWIIFLGVLFVAVFIFLSGFILAKETYNAVHTTNNPADLAELQAYCVSFITMVIGAWIAAKAFQFSTSEKERD